MLRTIIDLISFICLITSLITIFSGVYRPFFTIVFIISYWWLFIVRVPSKLIGFTESKVLCKEGIKKSYGYSLGALIGILERTLLYIMLITQWWLVGLKSLGNMGMLILGILGIKSLYRFRAEKHEEDWIIIGTLLSVILGTIASLVALFILSET